MSTNNSFSVDAIELEKTYMVMDLRLAHCYSAFELSFLLGRHNYYVRDAENPQHSLQYSVNENNYLRQVFNCRLNKIMPGKISPVKYDIQIETSKNKEGTTVYRIFRVAANGDVKLYRTVCEEPKEIELVAKTKITLAQVSEYINTLLNEPYFDEPKTALMIFQSCQLILGKSVRPLYVFRALAQLLKKKDSPKLRIGRNDAGRAVYTKN